MQVEDTRGKTGDQNVSGLVVNGCSQVIKVPFLVEEVSTRAYAQMLYIKNTLTTKKNS